ncbi:MAG TPA: ankyrin repeat domain-containing protein [Thermoanaerobaculia bacterium]|nr:ankyrin repeat domain-containing protein [Thermoanaerobaculia bacterium]
MLKARAVQSCLILLLLLITGAATAQDSGDELRRAASAGDLAKVKELLDKGVDANAANQYGGTALAFACDKGHTEVVKLLLERGANPNVKDTFYNLTPIGWAAEKGHVDIIRLLLAKGAQGDDQTLVMGLFGGRPEILKALLEKGKFTPEQLSNALAMTQQLDENKEEMAKLLEAAGAKPPAPANFQVDAETLKSYEGTYEAEGGGPTVGVALKDGKLIATFGGSETLTLGAVDKVTFRPEQFPAVKMIFQVQDGKVTGLVLDQGGPRTMSLKKKETAQ